jgi:sterol desaturase/sphingolipid hydroxylase (fatty acid hydroxylase superfamily)
MNQMEAYLLQHESWIRLSAFSLIFIVMAAWEVFAPRRVPAHPRRLRWPANLGIVALNSVLLRFLLPVAAIAFAEVAQDRGWGLLNQLSISPVMALVLGVVALDLVIYFQHILFHAVPALWRLHRMHHADIDFDVTTGGRFHPVEILISGGIKLAAIAIFGPSAIAVLLFEVILNATSMFNHTNVRIPVTIDAVLRLFVVTPDMHRVHHSVLPHETNRNFGFNLPWWDRLFGTYRAQPSAGHEHMKIGIKIFREPKELRLDRMLLQPFRGDARAGGYPVGSRPEGE